MDINTLVSSITRRKILGGFAVGPGPCCRSVRGTTTEMPVEEKAEMAEKAEPKARPWLLWPKMFRFSISPTRGRPATRPKQRSMPRSRKPTPASSWTSRSLRWRHRRAQSIPILFAAGTPVGLFENTWGTWLQFVEGDLIVSLTPFMNRDGSIPTLPSLPRVWTSSPTGERPTAFPASMSVDTWAYNKTLFETAGLEYPPTDPEDPSWTMERFIDSAEKLTNGTEQFGMGRGYTGFNTFGIGDGHFFGGLAWDAENQKATMNNEHYRQGQNFWIDIVDKFHVMPTSEEHGDLTGGRTGHYFYSTGAFGMSVMYVGAAGSGRRSVRLGYWRAAVHRRSANHSVRHYTHATFVGNTDHVDQTWEVLKWLLDGENGLSYLELTGHVVTPMLHLFDKAKAHFERSIVAL